MACFSVSENGRFFILDESMEDNLPGSIIDLIIAEEGDPAWVFWKAVQGSC